MPNSYLNFSTSIDVKTKENVETLFQKWKELKKLEDEIDDNFSDYITFELQRDNNESSVVRILDVDGCGDPSQVIKFIQTNCHSLNLSGKWGFEWVETCSKRLTDSFSAGAVVLDLSTGKEISNLSTREWLNSQLS